MLNHPPTLRTLLSPHQYCLLGAILSILLQYGCRSTPQTTFAIDRPDRHQFTTKEFVIHSDVPLRPDDPLVRQLSDVQLQLAQTLKLQPQRDPVDVFLFSDETSYRNYLKVRWPTLPVRRAYFIRTSQQLAVYSFVSSRVLEDLRHEFTHGILHASCNHVPLWLDEGLAEYFEVSNDTPGSVSSVHLEELLKAEMEGWSPDLFRLEMLSKFEDLKALDYAESWGWIHFLLHHSAATRSLILDYIAGLRDAKTAPRLLQQLETAVPTYAGDLWDHVHDMDQQ